MRVLTYTPQMLTEACRALAQRVCESCTPDLVVGIRRGGEIVAREMLPVLPPDTPYISAEAHRNSSRAKNSSCSTSLLRHLPRPLTDLMRKAESALTARRLRACTAATGNRLVKIDLSAIEFAPKEILVVDDAVDTGSTLRAVVDILRQHFPESTIRTAAITLTQPRAILKPDYTLHADRTLIRFPWAADARD